MSPRSSQRTVTSDATIFIDANIYLRFYDTPELRKLLPSLLAQKQHVFVTQQVVNEVLRNQLKVAWKFFSDQLRDAIPRFKIPDGIFDADTKKILSKQSNHVHKFEKALNEATLAAVKKVRDCKDEVSTDLAKLFRGAVRHSKIELERAKERKALGNPPGKKTDTLGDQLSWEQLLTHLKGKRKLWLITNDGDYFTENENRKLLNALLQKELGRVEVVCYDKLSVGIADFAKSTGEGEQKLPPQEKLDEIKKDETQSALLSIPFVPAMDFSFVLHSRANRINPNRHIQMDNLNWMLSHGTSVSPSATGTTTGNTTAADGSDDPKE